MHRVSVYLRLVMFSHTLFSLPFAICMLLLIQPRWHLSVLILLALISARTLGNALNRVIDKEIDIKNPRTASRPHCTNEISSKDILVFTLVAAAIFFLVTLCINPWLVLFLPPITLMFVIYAYAKRFTAACHFLLGGVCAMSVVGVCLACKTPINWRLVAACTLSVAGFDIIYSIEDIEFDRAAGLHSIPAAWGRKASILLAGACLFVSSHFSGTFLIVAGLCSYTISCCSIVLALRGNYKTAAYRMNQLAGVIRLVVFGINYIVKT